MTTIESGEDESMRMTRSKTNQAGVRRIIGAVLLALAASLAVGCSALRLGYNQAPTLAYHWIDGYFDIEDAQAPQVRDGIDRFFEWHRRTQLPDYAALLARAQREVLEPAVTPQAMCAWRDETLRRLDAAVEQATPVLAALMPTLTPEQLRHFEGKLARNGREMRKDFGQNDRESRAKAAFERALGRYETLYGRLDESQRTRLRDLLAASPFDAERWLAERVRRNQELLQTLAQARTQSASPQQLQASVKLAIERALRSPRPEYRAYQERVALDQCAQASAMHAQMRPDQRVHARDRLRGWEEDMRLLAARAGNGTNGTNGTNGANGR
jgi:hypothetical protein